MWRIFKCLEWSWFQEEAGGGEEGGAQQSADRDSPPKPPLLPWLKPVPFFSYSWEYRSEVTGEDLFDWTQACGIKRGGHSKNVDCNTTPPLFVRWKRHFPRNKVNDNAYLVQKHTQKKKINIKQKYANRRQKEKVLHRLPPKPCLNTSFLPLLVLSGGGGKMFQRWGTQHNFKDVSESKEGKALLILCNPIGL